MPNALSLALKLGSRAYEKLNLKNDYNKLALGSLVGAGVAKFVGYELTDNPDNFPAPVLPSSKPKQAYKEPLNPSVKTVLNPLQEEIKKTVQKTRESIDWKMSDLKTSVDQITSINEKLKENASDSSFLLNQVALKDTMDSISMNMEAQTIILGSLYESLENNLSSLVAIKMVESQNAKVLTDYQKTIAAQSDMGQFFYEFISTSEYWAKADTAQVLYDARSHWETPDSLLPSRLYASDEIALIDSMEGYYTNSEIRSKVEAYRKERLSADVRALIGQTAVAQAKDQADTNAKAKEYYATATESLKSKEASKPLEAIATAVAPIAEWAQKAKVRETYMTTPTIVRDLDGNAIKENIAPMELAVLKDASIAREKTDTINFEVDESDFPSFASLPIIPFVGRENIFNPNFSMPTNNPFTHKNIN